MYGIVELCCMIHRTEQARSLMPPPLHPQEAGHLKEAHVTVTMEPSCRKCPVQVQGHEVLLPSTCIADTPGFVLLLTLTLTLRDSCSLLHICLV